MRYEIVREKLAKPQYLFTGNFDFRRTVRDEDGYRNYLNPKFSIEIKEEDVEQFLYEYEIIRYFSGSKCIHMVTDMEMYTKYIENAVKESKNYHYEFSYHGIADCNPLVYVDGHNVTNKIKVAFTEIEQEALKVSKARDYSIEEEV